VTLAAGLAASSVSLWLAAGGLGLEAPTPAQKIAVEVRGPVAFVSVTRALVGEGAGERLLDVALPEGAALVDVALGEHGKWRDAEAAPRERATRAYLDRLERQGTPPAREPFDESTTFRVRAAADAKAPLEVRYRFALLPETLDGRSRLRFPPSPERTPAPAQVSVSGASDVAIAGARGARARASTRGAWEISWAPGPAAAGARLEGSFAFAKLSPAETLAAVSVDARGGAPVDPPGNLLLLVDRSRSVGLPGLSAERELAGRLLEALPPATRFDALFFDRQVRRLFPMTRPATREALAALDAELVPDHLQNGTDLPGALREAGALLRREASAFAPRAWLVVVTDGALPEGPDGPALARALGATPGVDLALAVFVVRPAGDDAAPAAATRALRHLAAARGGLLREVTASELDEALPPALATLARGGDVAEIRLVAGGGEHALAPKLAPGEGRPALLKLAALGAGPAEVVGTAAGARVRAPLRARAVDAAWLRALAAAGPAPDARLLATDTLVALVETPRRAPPGADAPHGSLDRTVVRNTLSLAYMPRARACYLNRTAATAAERDLQGRVRLAIDVTRGEVGDVTVQSSTLHHPGVEACLREGAFAMEVPRALRSDAPSTAILNLVFRPRTPERHETPEEAALGAQIDLVIEALDRTAPQDSNDETPPVDKSMIPTR
jgi:hypothetical protein